MNYVIRQWDDAAAYSYVDTLSDKLWAWEFLRRNPKYQASWNEALEKFYGLKERYNHDKEAVKNLLVVDAFNYSPDDKDFNIRFDEALQWGLSSYVNPCKDNLEEIETSSLPRFIAGQKHPLYKQNMRHFSVYDFAVIVEMTRPIKPQIHRIQKYLLKLQQSPELSANYKRPANHKSKWKRYLRILDAHNAKIKRSNAVDILCAGNIDTWNDTLKQAKEMSRRGYKDLLPNGLF